MRHLYLILKSYLILTSLRVNSNTFPTHNPKLSVFLNFRLSRGSLSTHQGRDGRHQAYYYLSYSSKQHLHNSNVPFFPYIHTHFNINNGLLHSIQFLPIAVSNWGFCWIFLINSVRFFLQSCELGVSICFEVLLWLCSEKSSSNFFSTAP